MLTCDIRLLLPIRNKIVAYAKHVKYLATSLAILGEQRCSPTPRNRA